MTPNRRTQLKVMSQTHSIIRPRVLAEAMDEIERHRDFIRGIARETCQRDNGPNCSQRAPHAMCMPCRASYFLEHS